MSFVRTFLKGMLTGGLTLSVITSFPSSAINLNFSALLYNGTCSLSVDKSSLDLGTVNAAELQAEKILNAQPFTLHVSHCTTDNNKAITPVVQITGDGQLFSPNKWLFRDNNSAKNVGIMVVKSDTKPSYTQSEIRSGTVIEIAKPGTNPSGRDLMFYAGVSCGGQSECKNTGTGSVTANLMFTFAYR